MSEWRIPDVGSVSTGTYPDGVRLRDVGFDLAMTSGEAYELAKALLLAAAETGGRSLRQQCAMMVGEQYAQPRP